MEILLRAKNWQIFIILLVGMALSNTTLEGDPTTSMIINLIGILIYFIYPFVIGYFLQDFLPRKVEVNNTFFQINFFVWIGGYLTLMILSDGQGMTLTGLAALPFFYVFFAFLYYQAFPAKVLKSVEMKKEVSLGDYFSDFILILFLPLGIWVLQPRINKVVEKEKDVVQA
ncbi:hypothetical protein [Rufibacter quisquiliarum]|uniref:Uncharacterized protein n=1 Tax=Rufibacter quisquiliarum TaxID=1549639 RepID=A0A839GM24_9BACT|nr:hypothetical protein [Rufibacter quisquiliarum]MBA9079892.1 hypothetical protein [Rufibacter quisquiliarum]